MESYEDLTTILLNIKKGYTWIIIWTNLFDNYSYYDYIIILLDLIYIVF